MCTSYTDALTLLVHPQVDKPKEGEITRAQLDYFLQRKQMAYSESAFAFFLQKCGSSVKKIETKAIASEAFVKAFDSVVCPPLSVE